MRDQSTLEASGYTLPPEVSRFYSWNVDVLTGAQPAFVITFTPTGGQAKDGALTLDSSGNKSPAGKWQK